MLMMKLNVIFSYWNQVSSYFSHLVLSHASRAVALTSAKGADPIRIVLSLLNYNVVKILEAVAAKLLLTNVFYRSIYILSFLLIFNSFLKNEMIDHCGWPRVDIIQVDPTDVLGDRHQVAMQTTIVLAMRHDKGWLKLLAIVTEAIINWFS